MRLSVITPTCDRPAGIALAERWMSRQTMQPFEWIVADGGQTPAPLTAGQIHLHEPAPPGPLNLAGNLVRGLKAATGDAVVIWEDDDYYRPEHLAACASGLARMDVHGCPRLSYYNVHHRLWRKMMNRGAALCQTALNRKLIPELIAAAERSATVGDYAIDGRFWLKRMVYSVGPQTVIGIKGLPGTGGLGVGHRPMSRRLSWHSDPRMEMLRKWIGADADAYADLA